MASSLPSPSAKPSGNNIFSGVASASSSLRRPTTGVRPPILCISAPKPFPVKPLPRRRGLTTLFHASNNVLRVEDQEKITEPWDVGLLCEEMWKTLAHAAAMVAVFASILAPLPLSDCLSLLAPAGAVLYSPDTKVPRTGELALRRAIPANSSMKVIQASLEEISYLLRIPQRKPYGTMESNVKKALKVAMDEKELILSSIPIDLQDKGSILYQSLIDAKGGLNNLLDSIKENDPDKVSVSLSSTLDTIAELELLQAPGLPFLLPEQYLKYPRLAGRGIVEFTFEKAGSSLFSSRAGEEPQKFTIVQVVIDGYSAPLTAGNFAKLVIDGRLNGVDLKCNDQAILSDNEAEAPPYNIPLEIKPFGLFEPLYRTALNVQDGELPVLPLSVYGAVAMAHSTVSDDYSSPSQFFIYLYDKRSAGLGGLSFDEGQFSVFGYTTVGREILPQIRTGDKIKSARLIEAQEEFEELCSDFGIELDDVTTEGDIIRKEKHLEQNDAAGDVSETLYKIEVPANRYDLLCLEGLAQSLRIFVGKDDTPNYKVVSVPPSSMIKMHVKPGTEKIRPLLFVLS